MRNPRSGAGPVLGRIACDGGVESRAAHSASEFGQGRASIQHSRSMVSRQSGGGGSRSCESKFVVGKHTIAELNWEVSKSKLPRSALWLAGRSYSTGAGVRWLWEWAGSSAPPPPAARAH